LNDNISKIKDPVINFAKLTVSNMRKNDAIKKIERESRAGLYSDFLKNNK